MPDHILNQAPRHWPLLPGDRSKQLFKALLKEGKSFSEAKQYLGNKSDDLLKNYKGGELEVVKEVGLTSGTQKMLLATEDHCPVESVWLPEQHKNTICLSSQSGCAYGCVFCATGKMGLKRNLKIWEIVDQVLAWTRRGKAGVTNLVFMGMGEPLANLDAVLEAADVLADTRGLGLSYKKMTISTVGVLRGINKLAEQKRQINLMLSLHATNDHQRKEIMPRSASIKELGLALKNYQELTGRRVGVSYLVKPGFNDSDEDVQRLHEFLKGLTFKLNLLCLNPINNEEKAISIEEVEEFRAKIQGFVKGVVTIRYPAGRAEGAACGQLGANIN